MKRFLPALFFFLLALPVHAVTVSILNYPTSISDDSFPVTIQVESSRSGTNYLRIDFYKESTKNYFGETDNGSYWYGDSNGVEYFPIEVIGGVSTTATFSARLGSPSGTEYPGPGNYLIRARRYTASGNQGSEVPESKPIEITYATPTPSPSPSPTSTSTPTSTPTPTPTPFPSPSPSLKPSLKPSPTPHFDEKDGTIAGLTVNSIHLMPTKSPSPSPSPNLQGQPARRGGALEGPTLNITRARTALLVGFGLIIISVAGFFGYRKYKSTHQL